MVCSVVLAGMRTWPPWVLRPGLRDCSYSLERLGRKRDENRLIARRRHLSVAGGAALVAAAVLMGLGAQPDWLAWTVGALAVVILWRAAR